MNEKINVYTQGISDDWMTATGDFDIQSRGTLDRNQVLNALLYLQPLDMPAGEDVCPPHVLTEGPAGNFSFLGQGGTLYCPDVEKELAASEAVDLALGRITMVPPPPVAPASASECSNSEAPTALPDSNLMQRKLGFRGIVLLLLGALFLVGAVMAIIAAFSMVGRGLTGDDLWATWTVGGMSGLIGGLLIVVAFKHRSYVDENGEVLPFVLMGHALGIDSFDDDID